MRAMIMAAGVGDRLQPLTSNIPKPMAPVVNRPVMEHILELLRRYNIIEIIANLHYHGEVIENYFKDGSRFKVNLRYSKEETLMGTAGGVKRCQWFLGGETFLIVSGDALTDIDLLELERIHRKKRALATIALFTVEDPSLFGVVVTDKDERITQFQEKPSQEEALSNKVNTGIYIFEPEIFDHIPENQFYDFGQHLFPLLLEKGLSFYGHEINQYWSDIGSIGQYIKSHYDILQGRVKVKIPGKRLEDKIWVGRNVKIGREVELKGPMVLGENCKIEKGAKLSGPLVLGAGCCVGEGAILQGSIEWGESRIAKGVRLNGCVLGRNCWIKANALISKGAVIGDGCIIGEGSKVGENVRIASRRIVGDNEVVLKNMM